MQLNPNKNVKNQLLIEKLGLFLLIYYGFLYIVLNKTSLIGNDSSSELITMATKEKQYVPLTQDSLNVLSDGEEIGFAKFKDSLCLESVSDYVRTDSVAQIINSIETIRIDDTW
jgi:hypothetical protein